MPTNDYYDKLATAFMHGQLSLLDKPPIKLSLVADPYIKNERKGIVYIWDFVYYKGRYYLYWGPVPALLLVPVKWLFNSHVKDIYLVFVYLYGTFLISTLFLVKFWQKFFPTLTGWPVVAGSLAIGGGLPAIWMLSTPCIYQAAIFSGQFWLISGILLALVSFEGNRIYLGWLAASSVCLSFAVGSRINLAFAVTAISIIVILRMVTNRSSNNNLRLLNFFAYLLPIILAGVAYMAYNYFRFGNPLEVGSNYQLTTVSFREVEHSFSISFLIPKSLYIFPFLASFLDETLPFHCITETEISNVANLYSSSG